MLQSTRSQRVRHDIAIEQPQPQPQQKTPIMSIMGFTCIAFIVLR